MKILILNKKPGQIPYRADIESRLGMVETAQRLNLEMDSMVLSPFVGKDDLKKIPLEKYDGFILNNIQNSPPHASIHSWWRQVQEKNHCVNVVDLSHYPGKNLVEGDVDGAAQMLAAHLSEEGFERIGFFGSNLNPGGLNRCRKLFESLKEKNLPLTIFWGTESKEDQASLLRGNLLPDTPTVRLIEMSRTDWFEEKLFSQLLQMTRDLDALVTKRGILALLLMEAAQFQNYKIPEDLALAGFDDDFNVYETAHLPLTVCHFDYRRMGEEAVYSLVKMINGKKLLQGQHLRIPVELRIAQTSLKKSRKKTLGEKKNSPFKQIAKGFVKANFRNRDLKSQLSQFFEITEEYFLVKFKQVFNIGFTEYLLRLRLEEAAREVEMTQKPFAHIAISMGFENYPHFSKQFKRAFGHSPAQLRKNRKLEN